MKIILDNTIQIKGKSGESSSKILTGFNAPFSSTVYKKLIKAKFSVEHVDTATEFNAFPHVEKLNLSSVQVIKDKKADAYVCNDYSGVIKFEALKQGLVYISPTFDLVSRHGVVASASSMDNIGVLARNAKDAFKVLYAIKEDIELKKAIKAPKIKELKKGCPYAPSVFSIISSAEFSNNVSRFDGVKFGLRVSGDLTLEKMMVDTRSEGFSLNSKANILLGNHVLIGENYNNIYDKALRLRNYILNVNLEYLKTSDLISIDFSETGEYNYSHLEVMALPSLTGLPTIAINNKIIFAGKYNEETLMALVGDKL